MPSVKTFLSKSRILNAAIVVAVLAGLGAVALAQPPGDRVVRITAERYEYSPDKVVLKKGEPVVLELVSRDRLHGFHVKGLNVRADVLPGQTARVRVTPTRPEHSRSAATSSAAAATWT